MQQFCGRMSALNSRGGGTQVGESVLFMRFIGPESCTSDEFQVRGLPHLRHLKGKKPQILHLLRVQNRISSMLE